MKRCSCDVFFSDYGYDVARGVCLFTVLFVVIVVYGDTMVQLCVK